MGLKNGVEIRGIEWSYNFSTARKILPLLDLLAKFRRVLACSCSQNFATARMLEFSLTLLDFLKFRTDHVKPATFALKTQILLIPATSNSTAGGREYNIREI